MVLNNLKIKNFRLFEDLEISKLGRVNLIVGKNNTGKTTLLEAINISRDTAIPVSYVSTSRDLSLATIWDEISLARYEEENVIQVLQLMDNKIEGLAFKSKEEVRIPFIKVKGKQKPIPMLDMGEGIYRLLRLFIFAVRAENGILLIDQLENGLHYSVQPQIWELLLEMAKQRNMQIIATTHSWDCVTSFQKVMQEQNEESAMLINLGRSICLSEIDKVFATEYDINQLNILTQAEMEVR